MVAYSFQRQFEAPLLARTKRGTIRADRKRHARPGEVLQLYTGMRTRQCRLIGTAIAKHVRPVRLNLDIDVVLIADGVIAYASAFELQDFAVQDGFVSWAALKAFWAEHHPRLPCFTGVQILWGDTFEAAA